MLRWLLWGTGIAAVLFAAWLTRDTSRRRPELLRPEDHQTVSGYLDWLQTTDIEDKAKIAAAEGPIAALLGKPKALKSEAREHSEVGRDERDG